MPTLLRPWRRRKQSLDPPVEPSEAREETSGPCDGALPLLLLVPTEGGLSFRLHPFPGVEEARRYARDSPPLQAHRHLIAFWTLQTPPGPDMDGHTEAIVIIRDPSQPEVAQLFSFVEMDAAQLFLRQEVEAGLDLGQVMVYWAVSVEIDVPVPPPRPIVATRTRERLQTPAPRRPPTTAVDAEKASKPETEESEESGAQQESAPPGLLSRLAGWPGWEGLAPHIGDALMLRQRAFDRVHDDPHASGRARLIVLAAIAAAALGASRDGLDALLLYLGATAIGWTAYAGTVYLMATLVYPARRPRGAFKLTLQTLGLATAPCFLLLLRAVPIYGAVFPLVAGVWVIMSTAPAVIASLEVDRQSAQVAAITGGLAFFAVSQVLPMALL
jgi:hypothetical protein